MAATVTLSVAGVSYAALKPKEAERQARDVAARATCRAIDAAVAAFYAVHDRPPTKMSDLAPYVRGDITAYRIVNGMTAGPGCP
jgi:hypothetical protein